MKEGMRIMKVNKFPKLDALYHYLLNKQRSVDHRTTGDTEMAFEIFQKLKKMS